jgi:hypothetical protein
MNVAISSFADVGDLEKERLVLKIVKDVDIGDYAVFCTSISSDGKATAGPKKAYWFPDDVVKSGDLVILYTKQGTSSTKELDDGRTAHFYYWRQEQALWDSKHGAVVLEISEWVYSKSSARSHT